METGFWFHRASGCVTSTGWAFFLDFDDYELGSDVAANLNSKSALSALRHSLRDAAADDPEISAMFAKLDAHNAYVWIKSSGCDPEVVEDYADREVAPLFDNEEYDIECELQSAP